MPALNRTGALIEVIHRTCGANFKSDERTKASLDVNELIHEALATESDKLQKHRIWKMNFSMIADDVCALARVCLRTLDHLVVNRAFPQRVFYDVSAFTIRRLFHCVFHAPNRPTLDRPIRHAFSHPELTLSPGVQTSHVSQHIVGGGVVQNEFAAAPASGEAIAPPEAQENAAQRYECQEDGAGFVDHLYIDGGKRIGGPRDSNLYAG